MKFLLVYPPSGGRLSVGPHLKRAIEECGYQVEVFDFSKVVRTCLSGLKIEGLKAKDRKEKEDLAFLALEIGEELFVKKALEVKPDIVLDIMAVGKDTIRLFRDKGIITCFWFLEDGFSPSYSYWRNIALEVDFFFTIQPGRFLEEIKAFGVKNGMYLPHGCDPEVHKRLDLSKGEKRLYGSDLSFMGAPYPNRVKAFRQLKDYDFKIWGEGWDKIEMPGVKGGKRNISQVTAAKIFNASLINLNLHSSDEIKENFGGDFANPRTFALAGCGVFQLVDKREAIPSLFKVDEEIVCFETVEELKEKIDYYLEHPTKREEIGRAAQERAYREHTYAHRIEEMVGFIRERRKDADCNC